MADFIHVDRFISAAQAAGDATALLAAMQEHLQQLGFSYFAYELKVPTDDGTRETVHNNYPSGFIERYVHKRYCFNDVVLLNAVTEIRPFLWSEVAHKQKLTYPQRHVFHEAHDAGLSSGAMIPLHGPGRIRGTLSIASPMPNDEFAALFLERRHELHLLGTYFHSFMVDRNPIERPHDRPTLSERQTEVLTLTAKGLMCSRISEALEIDERTVKDHLARARKKLRAKTTTEAVVVAVRLGLIEVP